MSVSELFREVGNAKYLGFSRALKRFCRKGWLRKAIQALEHMEQLRIPISTNDICCLLQGSIEKEDVTAGRNIHALIVRAGLESNSFLRSYLIRMFASFGSLLEANQVFNQVPELDMFTFGEIISANAKLKQGVHTIELYRLMQQSSIEPDGHVIVAVIKACTFLESGKNGKLIHAHIIDIGFESNLYIGNILVDMYAKNGSLHDARRVFDSLENRDIVAWNAMIAGYAKDGCCHEVLQLFLQMQMQGMKPEQATFVCILRGCAIAAALEHGKLIHGHLMQCGFELDVSVGSTLLDMYVKCGTLDDARNIFSKLSNRGIAAWNAIIEGCIQLDDGQYALKIFQQMLQDGVEPNQVTFINALRACSITGRLNQGKLMHAKLIECNLPLNSLVGNTLVDMYAKCKDARDSVRVFDRLPERDVATWNALIAGYVRHGYNQKALQLSQQMKLESIVPNQVTFLILLKACSSIECSKQGMIIHSIMESAVEVDESVWNTIVDMYGKCGSVNNARLVFDTLDQHDVVTWSALISGYASNGHSQEALQLFKQMQQEGVEPNSVTSVCILKACSDILDFRKGRLVHIHIIERGWEFNVSIGNSLIDMYAKFCSVEDACAVFYDLPKQVVTWSAMIGACSQHGLFLEVTHLFWQMREEGVEPDIVSWNAMISSYAHLGQLEGVFQLLEQMQQEGLQPNCFTFACILKACSSSGALDQGRVVHACIIKSGFESHLIVGTTLIVMYTKCWCFEDANRVFDKLTHRDTVTWNAWIAGHAQHACGQEAIEFFWQMLQEGMEPNWATFVSVLTACASTAASEQGRVIHSLIIHHGFESEVCVGNALIDMYNKCGSTCEACRVFDNLQDQDVVTSSVMMAGYSRSLDLQLAIRLNKTMEQNWFKHNDVTFVCLLSACSHMGLVEEGCHHFKSMQEDHDIFPTVYHYYCMVELLSRSGCLMEAKYLVQTVPFHPNPVGLTSLLNHCRIHGNVEVGKWCFNFLYMIDCSYSAGYTLMAHIYASAGMWEDAIRLEELRILANAWKMPGKAFVEIGNKVHDFIVGDQSHPQSEEIYAMLRRLHGQKMEEGVMN